MQPEQRETTTKTKEIEPVVRTLRDLLRIPSYSGQEREKQEYIFSRLAEEGIDVFFQDENLIARINGEDPTKAFIFNGHVDVVDVGNRERWVHDPWGGEMKSGKIYGRGASDMQAGVASMIEAAISLAREAKTNPLPCDIWFTFVAREEQDGSGTASFAKWFKEEGYADAYHEIAAVFAEPTGLVHAEYGHRGNFFIKAEIEGATGHSSRPREIHPQAIIQMNEFIHALQGLNNIWFETYNGGEFAPPTIVPTSMEAESASPNKVADHAEASLDLRTVPNFHDEAYEQVRQLAEQYGITLSLLFPDAPTGYTQKSSKIIRALLLINSKTNFIVSEGSADLGFLTGLGIEGIMYGPGEIDQCHIIDESARISTVKKAPAQFIKLYKKWASLE